MRKQHLYNPNYDMVEAFVDVFTTLRPDCDAGRAARWFGSKAGIPVERLQTRDELVAWLQGGASTASSRLPGEQLAETGHAVTGAVTAQPEGSEPYDTNHKLAVPQSTGQAATPDQNGAKA